MMNGESFCFAGSIGTDDLSVLDVRFQSAWQTYLAGNCLLLPGVAMIALGWWQPSQGATQISWHRCVLRFLVLYSLGAATVCIWHGIWYFLDTFLYPSNVRLSRIVSAIAGAFLCFLLAAGNSLLAPPAIFLFDGPGALPPPVTISIVMSYRSIALPAKEFQALPQDPYWFIALDLAISYLLLPWGVVGFWRGAWYIMDASLWNFETTESLYWSIFYSYLIGVGCLGLASEDVVQHFPSAPEYEKRRFVLVSSQIGSQLFGRVRTMVLAIGAVNFWRGVWLTWDEWLGSTSTWSAALGHVIAIIALTLCGCLSCITAPPSTVGADAVANPGTIVPLTFLLMRRDPITHLTMQP